jgi:hypothetical protein
MNVLIAKLGATGDVVRTTTLLSQFHGHVSWITEPKNAVLLRNHSDNFRCLTWEERGSATDRPYDLVINLEDTIEVGSFLKTLNCKQLFGAFVDSQDLLRYSEDSWEWFDPSLISRFGRQEDDKLKFQNRRTYQDLIFSGLGFTFAGGDLRSADGNALRRIRRHCVLRAGSELRPQLDAVGIARE